MKKWARRRRGEPKPAPPPPAPIEVWEWWPVEIRLVENGFTWNCKTQEEAQELRKHLTRQETGIVEYGDDSFNAAHIVYVRCLRPIYRTQKGGYPDRDRERVVVPWD